MHKKYSSMWTTWKGMSIFSIPIIMIFFGCQSPNNSSLQHITWSDYGGGPDQSKFVDLHQIDKYNVKNLEVDWFYPTGDNKVYQFNPIVVDSVMYVLGKNNSLIALNASTGKEIWIHANLPGMARRGINYWESGDKIDQRLIFQINNYLQAIDAKTGKSILSFGENGLVDLREGLGRDPNTIVRAQSGTPGKIFEDLILLGTGTGESYMSTPGFLRAYNVISGELVWTFHTIPQPGEHGYDTWPEDAYKYIGGINTWGEISVDEERGIAYYPLGSPTYDYYGADRKGSNLFGNCILALDARTGKRIWHYQVVHHDLWDYDLTAAPQLITVNHEGQNIDAVAVATKHGFMFVFDRVSGESLWPIEEKAVPESHVPGEETWPTQPFPTVLPPISRQQMTKDDISPVFLTDEERGYWENKMDSIQQGFFTPLSHKYKTLSIPGAVGGVNWGNTASNPKEGMVYTITIDWPSFYEKLQTLDQIEKNEGQSLDGSQSKVYVQNCQACHGVDLAGLSGPSLLNLGSRLSMNDFKRVVTGGRGDMPAFSQYNDSELEELFMFLNGNTSQRSFRMGMDERDSIVPDGPVVASGGVPGGLEPRKVENPGGRFGAPYPEGLEVPKDRYYLRGWGLESPFVIQPPWSEIVAYDLNKGIIKWRRPLGQDEQASAEGFENTGVLRAQRNAMVITATRVIFSTAKDGHVYAFDADNGEELWKAKLPTGSEGLPAMYELNGKQYLAVTATTPVRFGKGEGGSREMKAPNPQGGYVVFSLPD